MHILIYPVHGQWTEWSTWSACSQSCGIAIKSRRRTCGNPAPRYGGRNCIGPDRDETYCSNNPPCPGMNLIHTVEFTFFPLSPPA